MEEAHKRFEKLICGHLYIFDFHFLDTLHLPFLSQRLLALYQQFTHFWTCSLWKVLIRLFWCAREHLNYKWLTWQCYFNRIHLAKTALLCLYLKKEQKDKYCWPLLGMVIWWLQYIFFNIRMKHRVIFQNGAFRRLKAAHRIQRIFQQFLQAVCLIIQLFKIIVYFYSFPPPFFSN